MKRERSTAFKITFTRAGRHSRLFIETTFAAMIHGNIPENSGKDERIVMPRNCIVAHEHRRRMSENATGWSEFGGGDVRG